MSIHLTLLKSCIQAPFIRIMSPTLQSFNSEFFDLKKIYFRFNLNKYLNHILKKYYEHYAGSEYHCLPAPKHLLTTTDLQNIEGDLTVMIGERTFTFLMCSPFTMVYLQKRERSLYSSNCFEEKKNAVKSIDNRKITSAKSTSKRVVISTKNLLEEKKDQNANNIYFDQK